MAEQYSNRADLRNPAAKIAATATKGQTYGEAGKQIAAQKAVPMGAAPTDVQAAQPTVVPGQVADLVGPTNRPTEPISAGADFGDGPGSEIFGLSTAPPLVPNLGYGPGTRQDLVDQVRFVYSKFPNPAIFQLLLNLEEQPIQ